MSKFMLYSNDELGTATQSPAMAIAFSLGLD
jgi:hypothetical protein